jgi:hypothetical protein
MRAIVAVLKGQVRPNEFVRKMIMHDGNEAKEFRVLYYVLHGTADSAFLYLNEGVF